VIYFLSNSSNFERISCSVKIKDSDIKSTFFLIKDIHVNLESGSLTNTLEKNSLNASVFNFSVSATYFVPFLTVIKSSILSLHI